MLDINAKAADGQTVLDLANYHYEVWDQADYKENCKKLVEWLKERGAKAGKDLQDTSKQ